MRGNGIQGAHPAEGYPARGLNTRIQGQTYLAPIARDGQDLDRRTTLGNNAETGSVISGLLAQPSVAYHETHYRSRRQGWLW